MIQITKIACCLVLSTNSAQVSFALLQLAAQMQGTIAVLSQACCAEETIFVFSASDPDAALLPTLQPENQRLMWP